MVFFGVVVIWLLSLSYFTFRQTRFLEELFQNQDSGILEKSLKRSLIGLVDLKETYQSWRKRLKGLEVRGSLHLQKIELLRYNPYDDTGGDQSFSITLLDQFGSGFVVTSLHSRAGTRVFAKPVIKEKLVVILFLKGRRGH